MFTKYSLNVLKIVFVFFINALIICDLKLVHSKCEVPVKIYQDLHCKPIYSRDLVSLCPKRFDCSHLINAKRIGDRERKCYFNDRWYDVGDLIQIPSICGVGICRCTESLNFDCSKQECPYMHLPDVNHCFPSYVFDQCCPKTYHCLSEWKNLSTCGVKNTVYLEGELFPSPLDNCELCVCTKDFDANFGPNVCRLVPCRMELFKSADLLKYCAPVYLENTDCCPVDVRCPNAAEINELKHEIVTENDMYCVYGSIKVKTGVKVIYTTEDYGHVTVTECSCNIPPFMTCYRSYYS